MCQSNGEERLARPQLPSPVTQVPACSEKAKCVLLGKKPLGARSLPRTSKSGSQVEAPTASLSSPHPSCKRMADARVPGIALFPGTAVGGGGKRALKLQVLGSEGGRALSAATAEADRPCWGSVEGELETGQMLRAQMAEGKMSATPTSPQTKPV